MKTLAIGKAAAATGLSADTIRYYERRGILPRSERADNGRRRYDQSAIDVLLVIRRGRDAGLPLPVLTQLFCKGGAKSAVLRAQLSDIDNRMTELQAWREALAQALELPSRDATELITQRLRDIVPRAPRRRR